MKWLIVKDRINDKNWIRTQCPDCGSVHWLSFEFIYYALKGIAECEDEKYPYGKGKHMVTDFIKDVIETDATWEELRAKYMIPKRDN